MDFAKVKSLSNRRLRSTKAVLAHIMQSIGIHFPFQIFSFFLVSLHLFSDVLFLQIACLLRSNSLSLHLSPLLFSSEATQLFIQSIHDIKVLSLTFTLFPYPCEWVMFSVVTTNQSIRYLSSTPTLRIHPIMGIHPFGIWRCCQWWLRYYLLSRPDGNII